jgi:hypothetical protein
MPDPESRIVPDKDWRLGKGFCPTMTGMMSRGVKAVSRSRIGLKSDLIISMLSESSKNKL